MADKDNMTIEDRRYRSGAANFGFISITYHQYILGLYTGCPVKLSTLRFCYFLGFQITYKRTSDHFSIAQEMRISKLTLLYFLDEKLIKLQHKT